MGFLLALSFLTRIPLPAFLSEKFTSASEVDLASATPWFPVIGMVVGAGGALVYFSASLWFGPLSAAVLALTAMLLLTGALHVDGLADTADGLCCSGWNRERALEVMHDPRVGAAGAAAVTVVLLAKAAFLAEMRPVDAVPALLLAPVAGRWALVLAMILFPSARRGGGQGGAFASSINGRRVGVSTLLFVVVVFAAGGGAYFFHALASVAAGLLMARYLTWRLGGLTGDTYGAVNELVETAFLALVTSRLLILT